MGYLRKRDTGAVTDWLSNDSPEYQKLKAMKFQSNVTAAVPSSTTGLISGETGGTITAGSPVWEDISEQDIGEPDPAGGRVLAIAVPPTTTAQDETVDLTTFDAGFGGTISDVEYVPDAAVTGQATNNRTITLQQTAVSGTTSPARAVTALAAVTWDASHSNAGGSVPTPLTITQASFTSADPSTIQVASVHNGTGLADPGGVLYAVYTRA